MPIEAEKRLTAWSYSRIQKRKQCPLACRLANIDSIREPESADPHNALVRGKRIESEAFEYVLGKGPLPESCKLFPTELVQLRKIKKTLRLKMKIAFDKNWGVLCLFDGGGKIPQAYFGRDVWLRMEFDAIFEELLPGQKKHWRVHVVDLKTGKIYAEKFDQFELYNLIALILAQEVLNHDPQVSLAEGWYLDHGKIDGVSTMLKSDVEKEKKRWEHEANLLLSETVWQPKPGNHCRWCFYRKQNKDAGGGQCLY
jgi:RecB family exonuclease